MSKSSKNITEKDLNEVHSNAVQIAFDIMHKVFIESGCDITIIQAGISEKTGNQYILQFTKIPKP